MRPTNAMPEATQNDLRTAYDALRRGNAGAASNFAARVRAGRTAGWSWLAIADAVGVSGERLRQLERDYGSSRSPVPPFPAPQEQTAHRVRVSPTTSLSQEKVDELRTLARKGTRIPRNLPYDDPRRAASRQLDALLVKYRDERITWRELAHATGCTEMTVRTRVRQSRDYQP